MIYISPITSSTWSACVSYLVLTGIPLLLALPSSASVDALTLSRLSMGEVFITVATLLFTFYSLNFGPLHAKLSSPPRQTVMSLLAEVFFLMVLSLPYWAVFEGVSGHSVGRVLGALLYLVLYGTCWALMGLAIGLRWPSEITQFTLKYVLLLVSLIGTFFVLRPLNPFLVLSLWFGEGSLQWGFLVMSYVSLLAGAVALVAWTSVLLKKRDQQREIA